MGVVPGWLSRRCASGIKRRRAVLALFIALLCVASLAPVAGAEDKRALAYTTWHTDQGGGFDLRVVNADGTSGPVVASDPSSNAFVSPTWSPDGKMIAFSGSYGGMGGVFLVSAAGGQVNQLVAASTPGADRLPSWSPDGSEIAYWAGGGGTQAVTLMGIHPDGSGGRVIAGPFPALPVGGGYEQGKGFAPVSWSPDGRQIAFDDNSVGEIDQVAATGGAPTTLVPKPAGADAHDPAYSPDGTRIAYLAVPTGGGPDQVIVRNLKTNAQVIAWQAPDTYTSIASAIPPISWSADSDRIAYAEYSSTDSGVVQSIVTVKSDGSGGRQVLVTGPRAIGGIAWANAPKLTKHVAVSLSPSTITADGQATTTATANVTLGISSVSGDNVSFASSDGGQKIGPVHDEGDGRYTATITASDKVEKATITATDNSDPAKASGTAALTQDPPKVHVSLKPTSIAADGRSTAIATVTLTGVHGETVSGQDVSITTAGPAAAGKVTDRARGTYTATITATHTAGTVTVTGTDRSVKPSAAAHASLKTKAAPKKCVVPKLHGDSLKAAKRALRRAHCTLGKVTKKASRKVAKGHVISSRPPAGTRRKRSARIAIVLSRGKH